jgi:hypothetical protein
MSGRLKKFLEPGAGLYSTSGPSGAGTRPSATASSLRAAETSEGSPVGCMSVTFSIRRGSISTAASRGMKTSQLSSRLRR